MKREESTYIQQIESTFLAHRGKGLMISDLDERRILEWSRRGVPLEAAKKGIERAVERFFANETNRHRQISLAYCEGFVKREHAKQLANKKPEPENPGSENPVNTTPLAPSLTETRKKTLYEGLVNAGKLEKNQIIQEAYRQAYRRIKRLAVDEKFRENIRKIDKALCDEIYQNISQELRNTIDESVALAQQQLSSAAEAKARKRFITETRRKEIRKKFRLFHLEL